MTRASIRGPWSHAQVRDFLAEAELPIRLSVCNREGYPTVVSLWYLAHGDAIHCITHRDSALAANLRRQTRVGFEISPNHPPYFGLRGTGDCQLTPLADPTHFARLIERYLSDDNRALGEWLLSRSDEELLLQITPRRWFSWDYRARMAPAG